MQVRSIGVVASPAFAGNAVPVVVSSFFRTAAVALGLRAIVARLLPSTSAWQTIMSVSADDRKQPAAFDVYIRTEIALQQFT